ncbi:MAG: SLC13 family permease [Phycisphaerae bacterium]|nr:SLC13 family permease [Phycisphaerae bacterium]
MEAANTAPPIVRLVGLIVGPIAAVLVSILSYETLGYEGALVAGLLVWMATWWLTLAVDLAVTALLPVLLLPMLRVTSFAEAAAPYANDVIFLFGSGFVIAAGLERAGLTGRFAAIMVRLAGTRATAVVAALMLATALTSAFVSNTATAAAMLPVAIALALTAKDASDEVRRKLLGAATLGVAYAANIGGAMTLIGSPPNAIAARYIEEKSGTAVTFVSWLGYGLPIGVVLLFVAWFVLVRVVFPIHGVRLAHVESAPSHERDQYAARAPSRVLTIFLLTVVAWLTRPLWGGSLPGLSDAGIAIGGAVLMLTVPRTMRPYAPLLSWHDLANLPWGVLVLFGGGLSIAAAVDATGVAAAIAQGMSPIAAWPIALTVLVIVTVACFGSELVSNTALAATSMPLVGGIAMSSGAPLEPLAIAAALGCGLAFMLPVGTPPNAMAYAAGHVRPGEMMKAGILLNVVAVTLITVMIVARMALRAGAG